MRFFYFVTFFLSLMNGYAAWRCAAKVKDLWPHTGLVYLLFGTLLCLELGPLLTEALSFMGRATPSPFWIKLGFIAIGFSSIFFIYLIVADGLDLAALLFLPQSTHQLVRLSTLGAASLGVLFTLGLGLFDARTAEIERLDLTFPALPAAFDGFTIVQLSDLHIGPEIDERYISDVTAKTQNLSPDMIVITGDLIDAKNISEAPAVALLGDLHAPFGRYFVTGNHEYYRGAGYWMGVMQRLGFEVLTNRFEVLRKGKEELLLGGIPDPTAWQNPAYEKPDVAKTFETAPEGAFKILLSHQPVFFDEAAGRGINLTLSGHTHGGQYFPFTFIIRFFQPYVTGLHRKGDALLYINRGTGFWGPPLRTNGHGAITFITLHRGPAS